MLAEVLERSRDQVVDELERRATVIESTELSGVGRRNRLGAFVDELIGALCRGQTQGPPEPLPRSIDEPVLELRERDLVQRYLIDKIEQRDVVASPPSPSRPMTAHAGLPTRLIASSPLPWKPLQAPSSIERPRHSGRGHARLST